MKRQLSPPRWSSCFEEAILAAMANGAAIQVNTPSGLYDRPKTRQVAAFVRTMNFFDATVCDNAAGRMADSTGLGRQSLNGQAGARSDGDRVLVAIRPESLTLSSMQPEHAPLAVTGRVEARQHPGGRQHLHIRVEGRDAPVAVSAGASRGEDPRDGREGRPVWVTWGPEALTVLDPD